MQRFVRWTTLASTLGFLAFAAVAGADEEKIPVKQLPKAVRKAVKAKFPKAEIEGAAKEEEGGKTTYEVMLKVKGRAVDVALQADGTILEIEKEVAAHELPGAVKRALAARYPKAKIEKAETITKGEHGPTHYEIAIKTEIVLSAKGKLIEAAEAEEAGEEHEKSSAKPKKEHEEDEEDEDDDDAKSHAKSKKGEHAEHAAVKGKKSNEHEEEEEDHEKSSAKSKKGEHREHAAVKSKKSKEHDEEDDDEDEDDEKSSAKSKMGERREHAAVKSKKSKGHEEKDDDDDDDKD